MGRLIELVSVQSMWPSAAEIQELLDRVQVGEREAVDRLLERHREALRRLIGYRMDRATAARVDASDIVQDVLLEASQRLAEYVREPRLPFHAWLRGLARDRLIDMHRKHRLAARRSVDREQSLNAGRFPDHSSLELAAQLCDPELTPAAAAIRAELDRRFEQALTLLEEPDREILLMRHFAGLSNSEAAELLGVTAPTAGMRYLRALRRLRAILDEKPSSNGSLHLAGRSS